MRITRFLWCGARCRAWARDSGEFESQGVRCVDSAPTLVFAGSCALAANARPRAFRRPLRAPAQQGPRGAPSARATSTHTCTHVCSQRGRTVRRRCAWFRGRLVSRKGLGCEKERIASRLSQTTCRRVRVAWRARATCGAMQSLCHRQRGSYTAHAFLCSAPRRAAAHVFRSKLSDAARARGAAGSVRARRGCSRAGDHRWRHVGDRTQEPPAATVEWARSRVARPPRPLHEVPPSPCRCPAPYVASAPAWSTASPLRCCGSRSPTKAGGSIRAPTSPRMRRLTSAPPCRDSPRVDSPGLVRGSRGVSTLQRPAGRSWSAWMHFDSRPFQVSCSNLW